MSAQNQIDLKTDSMKILQLLVRFGDVEGLNFSMPILAEHLGFCLAKTYNLLSWLKDNNFVAYHGQYIVTTEGVEYCKAAIGKAAVRPVSLRNWKLEALQDQHEKPQDQHEKRERLKTSFSKLKKKKL